MACSLWNLVSNLAEGIHKTKCKSEHNNKTQIIKCKECDWFLQYTNVRYNLTEYKCLYCNKNYQRNIVENWKERFLIHANFQSMISISLLYYC